jgi:hypothetical protein
MITPSRPDVKVFLLGAFLNFISHYFYYFVEGNFNLAYSIVLDGEPLIPDDV